VPARLWRVIRVIFFSQWFEGSEMPELGSLGKILILFGLIIAGLGVIVVLGAKIPWLGRLPGDILIRRKNFTFYFPLATCIIINIILTLIFWLLKRK
jgi:hypothetical protein